MKKLFSIALIVFLLVIFASLVYGGEKDEDECYVCRDTGKTFIWHKIRTRQLEDYKQHGYYRAEFDEKTQTPKCQQTEMDLSATPVPTPTNTPNAPERPAGPDTTYYAPATPIPETVNVQIPTITGPVESTSAVASQVSLPNTSGQWFPWIGLFALLGGLFLFWRYKSRQLKESEGVNEPD